MERCAEGEQVLDAAGELVGEGGHHGDALGERRLTVPHVVEADVHVAPRERRAALLLVVVVRFVAARALSVLAHAVAEPGLDGGTRPRAAARRRESDDGDEEQAHFS